MGVLGSEEREELIQLREELVNRMHDLQDQEDQGLISAQERYQKLENEYGEDYLESLSEINRLLHTKHHQEHKIPSSLIILIAAFIMFSLGVSALFISPTGLAVLSQTQNIPLELTLQPGQNAILNLPETTTITAIQLTGKTTLLLEDANQAFTLYENTCVGCGQTIQEPYLLTNKGEVATTIHAITVQI